jgi:tetratricopeptide (TPR) repeat protein
MTMGKRWQLALLALVSAALFVLAGCSGRQARGLSPEDNPEHHYLVGMNALEQGRVAEAQEKFERALYLDDEFAKGYAGLAITCAERAKRQSDAGFRKLEAERALDNLEKAEKQSDSPEDQFERHAAAIRVHTLLKGKGWLTEAEDACRAGSSLKLDQRRLTYYQGSEALSYFLGVAYLEGLEFQKARDRFAEVMNAKREGKWHEKADRGWQKTDRVLRAMAGITVGDVGKKIAVQDAVSRGDLAALLMDEMKLDRLFAGRIPLAADAAKKAEFTPADVLGTPFKEEILTAMKWRVRGLEPKYDETTRAYLFRPADQVSRGEMAFIMEDVLIKLSGDEKLASAYFGQEKSPFPDVRNTSPLYNAVMNMTTRGIMNGELSGEFRPNDPVDGADALLAVRVLKQRINTY